jgi:putative transposase
MRKSRFTEEQIIGMIKEQEAGLPTAAVCRKHGLSPATFCKLKAKYGDPEASRPARLRRWRSTNIKPADSRYDRGTSGGGRSHPCSTQPPISGKARKSQDS